jgi:hypothetical protein
MIELDLHGLRHDRALQVVENMVVGESQKGNFQLRIITGNSTVLQKKVTSEVLDELGFSWNIPSNNLGEIIVNYVRL